MVDLISAYTDGQTTPAETQSIKAHLADCAHCQGTLRRHQQTRRLLHLVGDDTWTPPDLRLRVAHALRLPEPARPRRWGMLSAAVAGIAALVLAIGLLGGQSLTPQASPSPAPRQTQAIAHAPASRCQLCLVRAMVKQSGLPRAQQAYLLTEMVSALQPPRPVRYVPLPTAWPASQSASNIATKGGEARQASVPSYQGLQAS